MYIMMHNVMKAMMFKGLQSVIMYKAVYMLQCSCVSHVISGVNLLYKPWFKGTGIYVVAQYGVDLRSFNVYKLYLTILLLFSILIMDHNRLKIIDFQNYYTKDFG